jgi:hypothetical protein
MNRVLVVALATLMTTVAWAEDPAKPATTAAPAAQGPTILDAIDLPVAAERARRAGIPEDQVRDALSAVKEKGEKPDKAKHMLDAAGAAAEESGPTDNFGAFVRSQLAEGKRGQDLAAAIRAEHQAHGKGKPAHAGGPPDGKAAGKGPPDGKGPGKGDGKGPGDGSGPGTAKGAGDGKGAGGGAGKAPGTGGRSGTTPGAGTTPSTGTAPSTTPGAGKGPGTGTRSGTAGKPETKAGGTTAPASGNRNSTSSGQ